VFGGRAQIRKLARNRSRAMLPTPATTSYAFNEAVQRARAAAEHRCAVMSTGLPTP
jgi:hypothetical protein